MKTVILLQCIIIASLMTLAIFAGIPMASSSSTAPTAKSGSKPNPSSNPGAIASSATRIHESGHVNESTGSTSMTPQGAVGSGWLPDTPVSDITETEYKQHPSIASYVDPTTNASTLFTVSTWQNRTDYRYYGRIYRSDDNGVTWYQDWWFVSGWDIRNPSITVVPYNETIFVAEQEMPPGGGNSSISVWRWNEWDLTWRVYDFPTDANYVNPHITSDFGYGTSTYVYVVYEKLDTFDYRELYFARTTDWDASWYIHVFDSAYNYCYSQASIAYAEGIIYVAYRSSATYSGWGYIDVAFSTDWGLSWYKRADVNWPAARDASWPSIAVSHYGSYDAPATVLVAYEYNATNGLHDIYCTWSLDHGLTWTGGDDSYHQIATSTAEEINPQLTVDGMGTETVSVGGNFHLIYAKYTGSAWFDLYYTQLPYWDIPLYYGGLYAYAGYHLGWSTPQGLVSDGLGLVWCYENGPSTITTYLRNVGGQFLWEPGVAFEDLKNYVVSPWAINIRYSTLGTDFSITLNPSNQTVVAGNSIGYYVTVNLLSGPSVTAYMGGTVNWPTGWLWPYASMSYDVSSLSPTGTCTCTLSTNNFMSAATYNFAVTATIGGYRRIVYVPYTVTAPKTLTLNISPTTAEENVTAVTFSGQLTPTMSTTLNLLYRFPHQTGTWKKLLAVTTTAAGLYKVTYTFPMTPSGYKYSPGMYDIEAFWVNSTTGSTATSPIEVLTLADTTPPTVTCSWNPTTFNPHSGPKWNSTLTNKLSEKCTVSVKIYSSSNVLVRTLLASTKENGGTYKILWDGKNDSNAIVAAGTYTCRITATDMAGNKVNPAGYVTCTVTVQ